MGKPWKEGEIIHCGRQKFSQVRLCTWVYEHSVLTFFEMIQVKLLLFKHNDVVQTLPSIQQALLGNHNE